MYVDSHVHLQPHGKAPPITVERIEEYVDVGRDRGVERIAITEHLFRFREAYELLDGWWDADANASLAATAQSYWRDHVSTTIAEYVRVVEDAKSRGLPVLLGIEMDWITGRGDELRRLLAPYDWDIVLGSVHWVGAWGIDSATVINQTEWAIRDTDEAFAAYASLLREVAASGLCDVLAHPDLPKLFGHRPSSFTPLHDAIIGSAAGAELAIELSSAGWNKPVAEQYPAVGVLERARASELAITLASDAHTPDRVGERFDDLAAMARRAGYQEFVSYEARRARAHALALGDRERPSCGGLR
jgi:histidinol-phosphatase (PHP family)